MQAQVQVNLQSALALTRWLARLFMLSVQAVQAAADEEEEECESVPVSGADADLASDSDSDKGEAIITASHMLDCIDVLCAMPPRPLGKGWQWGQGRWEEKVEEEKRVRMAVARAAGLCELVGNTEEGVLWSGRRRVLEGRRRERGLHQDQRREHLGQRRGEMCEREEEEEGGWEGEDAEGEEVDVDVEDWVQGRARVLGDVMDSVLTALGIGGMPMPMPSPMPSSSPGVAW